MTRQPRRLVFGRGPLPPDSELELVTGPLDEALARLGGEGVQSLLLEGGPTLATAFLRADLVDRLLLFVAPTLAGSGPRWVGELPHRAGAPRRADGAPRRRPARRSLPARGLGSTRVHRHRPGARPRAVVRGRPPGRRARPRRRRDRRLGRGQRRLPHRRRARGGDARLRRRPRDGLAHAPVRRRRQPRAPAAGGRPVRRPRRAGPRRRRRPHPRRRRRGDLGRPAGRRCSATSSRRGRSPSTASRSRSRSSTTPASGSR